MANSDYEILAETTKYCLFCKKTGRKVHNLILCDGNGQNYEVEYLFNEVRSWDRLYYSPRMNQSQRDNLPKTITSAIRNVIEIETLHRKYDNLIDKIIK